MKTKDAIAHFDGVGNLARLLNISRSAIYQWGDEVPEPRQFELEVKSGGALKASRAEPAAERAA